MEPKAPNTQIRQSSSVCRSVGPGGLSGKFSRCGTCPAILVSWASGQPLSLHQQRGTWPSLTTGEAPCTSGEVPGPTYILHQWRSIWSSPNSQEQSASSALTPWQETSLDTGTCCPDSAFLTQCPQITGITV